MAHGRGQLEQTASMLDTILEQKAQIADQQQLLHQPFITRRHAIEPINS
jgi:hypothetical protein